MDSMARFIKLAPGQLASYKASIRLPTHCIAPACSEVRFVILNWSRGMSGQLHPAAPHHLPAFITAPGETDVLMVVMAIFLVVIVLMFGILFLRLHTLPERLAHKGHKLQFEIVAVLGLLALFTHVHLFWVAGLLLALIDLPDFRRRSDGLQDRSRRSPDRPGEDAATDRRRSPGSPRSRVPAIPQQCDRRSLRRQTAPPRRRTRAGLAPARTQELIHA